MPNHVHLIVKPRDSDGQVASILKAIKQPVGRLALDYLDAHRSPWLTRLSRVRNGRTERLFWQSGGGYDRNVVEPTTLAALLAYVHENPVRRGFAERASDWRWSSAGWFDNDPKNDLRPDRIPPEWYESIEV